MPGSKTIIFPILLGALSLCGVSATLLYIWLKRKEEESRESQSDEVLITKPIEIKVKNDLVPIIVGRGGATIRDIEDKSGATVYFKEHDDDETYCMIKGTTNQMDIAKNIIADIIESAPLFETDEMWVPQTACGRIIGRCGEALLDINQKSNAKVTLDPPLHNSSNGTDSGVQKRRIVITGTPQQISDAKAIIAEKVKQDTEIQQALDVTLSKREPRGAVANVVLGSSGDCVMPQREKLQSVGTDGTMEVYVSAVYNPQKFWLQLLGPQAGNLDSLVENMTEYYNKEENRQLHVIHSPQVGQIVAAMFNMDNKWYRAQVQAIQPSDYVPCKPVLDLYFVDYGDNSYASPQEVFELSTDFLTLRFQAIECFLANVSPPSTMGPTGDSASKNWPEASVTRFEELTQVAHWKKLWSRVVSYKERDDDLAVAGGGYESPTMSRSGREGSPVPGVELFDSKDGRDINIGVELANEGLARLMSETSRGTSPGAFGDLGKVSVLNTADKKTDNVTINGVSHDEKHAPTVDLVNAEKYENSEKMSDDKQRIMNETRDFIKGINNEASDKVGDMASGSKHVAEDLVKVVDTKVEEIVRNVPVKDATKDNNSLKSVEIPKRITLKIEEQKLKIVDNIKKVEEKKSDIEENVKTKIMSTEVGDKLKNTIQKNSNIVESQISEIKDKVEDIVPDNSKSSSHENSVPKSPVVDFMPSFTKTEISNPDSKAGAAASFLDSERNGHENKTNGINRESQDWTQL